MTGIRFSPAIFSERPFQTTPGVARMFVILTTHTTVLKDESAYQIPSAPSEQRRLIGVGYSIELYARSARTSRSVPSRKKFNSNVATICPDQRAIAANARILKQHESKIMRDICNGGQQSETRAVFRHIPDSTANGLRVRTKEDFGGAMHRMSRAFSVFGLP